MEAYDLGTPTPLSSDLDLIIYVRNINDYEPQFLIDIFNINFTEEQTPGSEKILLPETIDRDEVDELDDPPTQVCYFIISGNEDGLFTLDIFKHELSVSFDTLRENFLIFLITFINYLRPPKLWTESNRNNIC